MRDRRGGRRRPACLRWRWTRPGLVVLAVGLLAAPGCTADPESVESHPTPAPATTAAPSTPVPETPAEVDVPVEFAVEVPDPLCPPGSAVDSFPEAEDPYVVSQSSLDESDSFVRTRCRYWQEGIQEDALGMFPEEHVRVTVTTYAYRDWSDSTRPTALTLPAWSDELEEWYWIAAEAAGHFWSRASWEGCGRATECAEGEEPTIQVHYSFYDAHGRVGNLLFIVTVSYYAEELPEDVEMRTIAILRDLVLATVDGYERIE